MGNNPEADRGRDGLTVKKGLEQNRRRLKTDDSGSPDNGQYSWRKPNPTMGYSTEMLMKE